MASDQTRYWPWSVLDIDETADGRAVQKVYAAKLKAIDPAEDVQGFQSLNQAYKAARQQAKYLAAHPPVPEDDQSAEPLDEEPVIEDQQSGQGAEQSVDTDADDPQPQATELAKEPEFDDRSTDDDTDHEGEAHTAFDDQDDDIYSKYDAHNTNNINNLNIFIQNVEQAFDRGDASQKTWAALLNNPILDYPGNLARLEAIIVQRVSKTGLSWVKGQQVKRKTIEWQDPNGDRHLLQLKTQWSQLIESRFGWIEDGVAFLRRYPHGRDVIEKIQIYIKIDRNAAQENNAAHAFGGAKHSKFSIPVMIIPALALFCYFLVTTSFIVPFGSNLVTGMGFLVVIAGLLAELQVRLRDPQRYVFPPVFSVFSKAAMIAAVIAISVIMVDGYFTATKRAENPVIPWEYWVNDFNYRTSYAPINRIDMLTFEDLRMAGLEALTVWQDTGELPPLPMTYEFEEEGAVLHVVMPTLGSFRSAGPLQILACKAHDHDTQQCEWLVETGIERRFDFKSSGFESAARWRYGEFASVFDKSRVRFSTLGKRTEIRYYYENEATVEITPHWMEMSVVNAKGSQGEGIEPTTVYVGTAGVSDELVSVKQIYDGDVLWGSGPLTLRLAPRQPNEAGVLDNPLCEKSLAQYLRNKIYVSPAGVEALAEATRAICDTHTDDLPDLTVRACASVDCDPLAQGQEAWHYAMNYSPADVTPMLEHIYRHRIGAGGMEVMPTPDEAGAVLLPILRDYRRILGYESRSADLMACLQGRGEEVEVDRVPPVDEASFMHDALFRQPQLIAMQEHRAEIAGAVYDQLLEHFTDLGFPCGGR